MERLERLIAIEAIRELKARYCRLADYRNWDAFSQLFTPEGTMRFFDPAGALLSEVQGRAEPEGSRASFRTMRGHGHYHEHYRALITTGLSRSSNSHA